MDGWQFLRDLHDFLFGWLGWPTFREREILGRAIDLRDEHLKNADEVIAGYVKECRNIREQLAKCKGDLDKMHQHYKSMFS